MKRESEPRRIPHRYVELIDQAGERVRAEDVSLEEWLATYRRQHRHRLAADLWMVEKQVPSGARVLECGAVPLLVTAALVELDYAVSGVDLAPERFAGSIAALELDVRRCDVETEALPFDGGVFDAVLFNELFEHLRIDPIATLGEVHRVLRPQGRLLLSTPNLRSFRGLRQLIFEHRSQTVSGGVYEQYEKLERLGHMGHVREYTAREVARFLERVGLEVESVVYRGGHGRGVTGLAERILPSLRPFFSLVAVKGAPSR